MSGGAIDSPTSAWRDSLRVTRRKAVVLAGCVVTAVAGATLAAPGNARAASTVSTVPVPGSAVQAVSAATLVGGMPASQPLTVQVAGFSGPDPRARRQRPGLRVGDRAGVEGPVGVPGTDRPVPGDERQRSVHRLANGRETSVPASLAPDVLGVTGLNSVPPSRPSPGERRRRSRQRPRRRRRPARTTGHSTYRASARPTKV